MLALSSRATSNVSLGTGTTKFILLLSAIRIMGQRVAQTSQVLDRGLPARAITYTIAVGSRSAPKTRVAGLLAPSGLQVSNNKSPTRGECVPISGRSDPS